MVKTTTKTPQGTKTNKTRVSDSKFEENDLDINTQLITDEDYKIRKPHLLVTYFKDDILKGKDDIIKHWSEMSSKISKYILCEETAPTTGNIHYHLFISAEPQFQINGIRRLVVPGFKYPNVRGVPRENVKWCVMYCSKSDPSPLCLGYEPIRPRVTASMSHKRFEEMCKERFKNEPPTEEAIKRFAHETGQSVATMERFMYNVKSCLSVIIDEYYIGDNGGSQSNYKIPQAILEWMKALEKGKKIPLIIKSSRPEEVYEMLKGYGPHVLHKHYVKYEGLTKKIDHKDARFMVFYDVGTFNSTEHTCTRTPHISYMNVLFGGHGEFSLGKDKYVNNLPVVLIQSSNIDLWGMYKNCLCDAMYIETTNFDKNDYIDIINDHEEIYNANRLERKFNPFEDECDINDYVIVRYVPTTIDIEVDDGVVSGRIPNRITRYNYGRIETFYGVKVEPFEPRERLDEILKDEDKVMEICRIYEQLHMSIKLYKKLYKCIIDMMFSDAAHMSITYINSNICAVKKSDGWKLQLDVDSVVFEVCSEINRVLCFNDQVIEMTKNIRDDKITPEWEKKEKRLYKEGKNPEDIRKEMIKFFNKNEFSIKLEYFEMFSKFPDRGKDGKREEYVMFKRMMEERFEEIWMRKR